MDCSIVYTCPVFHIKVVKSYSRPAIYFTNQRKEFLSEPKKKQKKNGNHKRFIGGMYILQNRKIMASYLTKQQIAMCVPLWLDWL